MRSATQREHDRLMVNAWAANLQALHEATLALFNLVYSDETWERDRGEVLAEAHERFGDVDARATALLAHAAHVVNYLGLPR